MLFSSISFLYYFLPCVLILYFLVPKKQKNTVLLLASIFFYAWGEPKYVLLMLILIVVGYVVGLLFLRWKDDKVKKVILFFGIALCLGALGYFKYGDFFIENFNALTGCEIPFLKLALPMAISFYTFQIISYMVDVYRGEAESQKNIIHLAAYVSMFPQLIAGPILRYTTVEKQLKERTYSFDRAAYGIRRFILGLGKKVLIANTLGELCEVFKASQEQSVVFLWIYAIAVGLQVYFDFSGYSDMAIGLGKLLGFSFPENFQYPFISKSITEFWRRWHISLGTWFRDYVYIPLGGNRVGKLKWFRNILIVWFLTGFWHGAAWNFIVWGLFFGILLVIEKKWLLNFLKNKKVISRIYVLLLVIISFVIFNAGDMPEALHHIHCMFGGGDMPLITVESIYYLKSYGVVLIIACIGATPLMKKFATNIQSRGNCRLSVSVAEIVVLFAILIVVTAYLVDGSYNPFLYFRF